MTWQQEIVRSEDRERQQRQALTQPFGMTLNTINSNTEQGKWNFFGATDRHLTVIHPFNSGNSWIRAMPEEGTTYLGIYRSDEANAQPITSVTRNSAIRTNRYNDGSGGLYRPLTSGELEINSIGNAQAYFSRRPFVDIKGGVISKYLDQDNLISVDRSPIHKKQLYRNKSNAIQDEERLGIVSRPKKLDNGEYSTWAISYPKINNNFIAEHYMHILNPAIETPTPEILFVTQKGQVVDIDGVQIKQARTQIPLRSREEYFANDDSSTFMEIDEKGNYYTELAIAATEGYELNIPEGSYNKNVAKDEIKTIGGNSEHVVVKTKNLQIDENYKTTVAKDYLLKSTNGESLFFLNSQIDKQQIILKSKTHYFIMDDTVDAEAMYLLHKSGAQINFDASGNLKIVTKSGNSVFLDEENKTISTSSGSGAFVSIGEDITISDASGAQILTMDGVDTVQISSKANVNLSAQNITLGSGSVNIGNLASLSAVLAEPLAQLFDMHTHASPTGPTSPPLPPNTATIANLNPATSFSSAWVKLRTNLA